MNNTLSNTNKLNALKTNRKLILQLASLALIQPIVHMTGVANLIGGPIISSKITSLISIIWIIVVLSKRVEKPFSTLVYTGIASGIYVVLFGSIFSTIFSGGFFGLITNPFAFAGVMVANTFWGFMTGIFASLLYKIIGINEKQVTNEGF